MFRLSTLQRTTRLISHVTPVRHRFSLPYNTCAVFVPTQEAWVIERMGKFHSILDPGLNFLIPILDRIKYVQVLKEIAIEIPKQSAVTSDNVSYFLLRFVNLSFFINQFTFPFFTVYISNLKLYT